MDYSKLYEYYIFLFFKYNYNDTSPLKKENYDLDEVYNYMYLFWKDYFDEELDLSNEGDKEQLFDFVNEVFRYKMLNDNLSDLYNYLVDEGNDEFFIKNQNNILNIVKEVLKTNSGFEFEEMELPKLSHNDLDKYFEEFLSIIDDKKEFLNIYKELKKDKKIIYLDLLSEKKIKEFKKKIEKENEKNNNFFYKKDEEVAYILFDRKGDISDFRTLTHEFIHYCVYSYNRDKDPYYLLSEFPSIFYEYIANKFLYYKGYSVNDINKLLSYRFKDIKDKSIYLSCINNYLDLFIENNYNISHEYDVDNLKKQITNYIEKYGEKAYLRKLNGKNNNPEIIANNNCDVANFYLAMYPDDLAKNYPYLIGNYLSLYYIKELVNKNISLKDMKKIVERLPFIDPKIILEIKEEKDNNKSLNKIIKQ